MITVNSYVPILRWKQSEKIALLHLSEEAHNTITPLIELVMPAPKMDKDQTVIIQDSRSVLMEKLPMMAKDILKYWGRDAILIDAHLIDVDLREKVLREVLHSAGLLGMKAIPIVASGKFNSSNSLRDIAVTFAKRSGNGVCFRINRGDLKNPLLHTSLQNFLTKNQLDSRSSDMLVDFEIIDDADEPELIVKDLASVPFLNEWRSFVMSGGAHPKDLSLLKKHEHHQLGRKDWLLWRGLIARSDLVRRPIFSDYTIQHPVYNGKHIPGMNISASIRYASEDTWEILRGEGLRNEGGAGYSQYPVLAQLLVEQPFYKGSSYSYGDGYIGDRASATNKNTGNPGTWLKAGISHHLTLTANQIASVLA